MSLNTVIIHLTNKTFIYIYILRNSFMSLFAYKDIGIFYYIWSKLLAKKRRYPQVPNLYLHKSAGLPPVEGLQLWPWQGAFQIWFYVWQDPTIYRRRHFVRLLCTARMYGTCHKNLDNMTLISKYLVCNIFGVFG